MSRLTRLIDAGKLESALHDLMERRGVKSWMSAVFDAVDFETLIDEAPSVDATEVIRCANCRYWGTGYCDETDHVKVCEYANYMVGANGYCVYGERKGEKNG